MNKRKAKDHRIFVELLIEIISSLSFGENGRVNLRSSWLIAISHNYSEVLETKLFQALFSQRKTLKSDLKKLKITFSKTILISSYENKC